LAGYATLAQMAGFNGLVITIDEFEVEHNLAKTKWDRAGRLIAALTSYLTSNDTCQKAPLSVFLASVGQDGNIGDALIDYMIRITDGYFYSLKPWSKDQLIALSGKIHDLYCRSYSLKVKPDSGLALSVLKRLETKGRDDSGLIRAFIKSYMGQLDLQFGPPEVSNEAG
jgi:hypothetical protein